MTTKVRTTVMHTLEHEGREFRLTCRPDEYTDALIEVFPDGRGVIGYLVHDTDVENPLEDQDGSGQIYRRYRDAGREEKAKFYEAMGHDEYGNETGKKNPYAVLLDVYIHSGEAWRIHNSGTFFPDEQWDVSNTAGVWVPDESCMTHIEITAAERSCGIKIGIRYANHKTTYYYEHDGHEYRQFRTVMAAVRSAAKRRGMKLDMAQFNRRAYDVAVECATTAVKEYNSWLSGDCYSVVVDTFDKDGEVDDSDMGGGYVGREYAEDTLKEQFDYQVEKLRREGDQSAAVVSGDGSEDQQLAGDRSQ